MNGSLTIHHLDKTTYNRLTHLAKRRGLTTEAAAALLIRDALSSESEIDDVSIESPSQLDMLAGTWSEREAKLFLQAVADFSQIDEELWQ
jgi:hypothetical protein